VNPFLSYCDSVSIGEDMFEAIALGIIWLKGTLVENKDEEVSALLLDSDGEWSEQECCRYILLQLLPFFLNHLHNRA
jgi:hypothetical protein